MDELERLYNEHNMTYEEIMELLEEEQYMYEDEYKPLNFHDDEEDEDF